MFPKVTIAATILVAAAGITSTSAGLLPKRPARPAFRTPPALELAHHGIAVLRWSMDNPGGTDVHHGVVRFGDDPARLTQVARSPNRINRGHATTTFRVRLTGLRPGTTYYFRAAAVDGKGAPDGAESGLGTFTMPGAGERFPAR
ncbi:MAG: fibronectin type III domain-containing protein [Deltaproteobacteria bacterium]|nr:fibronectin type III domain-containing protein [Deltaproteobacteria bacterium]